MMARYRIRCCDARGNLSIELAASSVFFIVFAFLASDMCYVLYGAYFNDRTCRDAARAAAQSPTPTVAAKKVNAIVLACQGNSLLFDGPNLVGGVTYNDYGGSPLPQASPYVQVTTRTAIKLPFSPISFLGGPVFDSSGKVSFTQTYTFPIVRLK